MIITNEWNSPRAIFTFWNSAIKIISYRTTIVETSVAKLKKDLRKFILKIQNAFDDTEWYPDYNFNLSGRHLQNLL